MLICGLYNPPKHNYRHIDLMNYVIGFVDSVLEKHPHAVIVCGGDLNQLDMKEFKALSGWSFLVEFLTRGNACLDNCLKTCPFHMLMKMDHEAFVLPAGRKLKPMRRKVHLRDTREHRKQALYIVLAAEDWGDILAAKNVNVVVGLLEDRIHTLMDECMLVKTVRILSRDLAWMSPLVKSMLRAKSKISVSNKERLKSINSRISEVINENRRNPVVAMVS